jgi:hypothetical protein
MRLQWASCTAALAFLPHSIFSFEIIAFSASSDAVLPISSRFACDSNA